MASSVVAAEVIDDWANGRAGSLDAYDGRLRAALEPAMRRLGTVADLADRAPRVALAAIRLSGWARREATRAVSGEGAPFELPRPRSRRAEVRALAASSR